MTPLHEDQVQLRSKLALEYLTCSIPDSLMNTCICSYVSGVGFVETTIGWCQPLRRCKERPLLVAEIGPK